MSTNTCIRLPQYFKNTLLKGTFLSESTIVFCHNIKHFSSLKKNFCDF